MKHVRNNRFGGALQVFARAYRSIEESVNLSGLQVREARRKVRCARCGEVSAGDVLFCEQCGAKFDVACSSCGATLSVGAKFCKRCGAPALGHETKPIGSDSSPAAKIRLVSDPHSGESLEGERKTVTALFADIKGSTELMRDLDPENARPTVAPLLHLITPPPPPHAAPPPHPTATAISPF